MSTRAQALVKAGREGARMASTRRIGQRQVWIDGRWVHERRGSHGVPEQWVPVGPRWHCVPEHWEH
jgi:hypothetical protein